MASVGFSSYRVYGLEQARSSAGHLARGIPEQEMGLQLVGICAGAHYVQISGTVCRPPQVPYRKRRAVPVQEHVSVRQCRLFRAGHKV